MPDVVMPQLGETVTEGTITRWFKKVGDSIAVDEVLFEVSTEKVDSEVPSPVAGVVAEIRIPEGETVEVGVVLAVVGDGAGAPAAAAPPIPEAAPAPPAQSAPPAVAPVVAAPGPAAQPIASAPVAAEPSRADSGISSDGRLLSPVVRRLIREHGLNPDAIIGSGIGGRITRKDVLDVIDASVSRDNAPGQPEPAAAVPSAPAVAPTPPPPETASAPVVASAGPPAVVDDGSEFVPFNNIRRRTGEHMVHSMTVSPHALTVVEVDYEAVEQVRRARKAAWKAEEGFSLTYLPFIMRAVVDALGEWPFLNASVEGDGLRVHRERNVGVAVDLDHEGLIVPVVQQADGMRLRALARSVDTLADKARNRKLGVDDITGGTFTISNNGSFGTFSTAAIINQPQVAVLSTDGISRRPVVVTDSFGNESIAIHSVGMLAMGWDHRAFDGGYAASFLGSIKSILEKRDWESEF